MAEPRPEQQGAQEPGSKEPGPDAPQRYPSEAERAGKALLLGAVLGLVLSVLAGRRSADQSAR